MRQSARGKPDGLLANICLWLQQHSLQFSRLLVGVLALACYLNSVRGQFVFDDSEAIVGNQDVDPATPLSRVFTDDFWGKRITDKTSHKSYRPLTVLTFRWNYWLSGGLKPFGFHLTNVVLHGIVSVLYLEVCRSLARGSWTYRKEADGRKQSGVGPTWPLLAALVFAVHPIHTESVAGVVGRAELASALCFFLAFLSYCRSCDAGHVCSSAAWVVLTSLLSGCAMLFKEQGITVMGICLVYDAVVCGGLDPLHPITSVKELCRKRFIFLRAGLSLTFSAALLWGRYHLMATGAPQFMDIDNPASFADSLVTRVLSYNYVYSLNAWLLVNPWWLCFDWSMGCVPLVGSLSDWRMVAIAMFWCGIGALVGYTILGKSSELKRLVTVSLAFLVIPFLPASNILFSVGFVVAERVLYLPSAGYCLLVALGIRALADQWEKIHSVMMLVPVLALLLLFMGRSIQRSQEWLTEETLFVSGAAVCPLNAKVHYNIGKVYTDVGRGADAESAYREAIR